MVSLHHTPTPWTWQLELMDRYWHLDWDGVALALISEKTHRVLWSVPVTEGWRASARASEAFSAFRSTLLDVLDDVSPLQSELEVWLATDQVLDLYDGLIKWVEALAWAPRSASTQLLGSTAFRRAEEARCRASLWVQYCEEA